MKALTLILFIALASPMQAALPLDLTLKKHTVIDRDEKPRVFSWPMLIRWLRR